MANNILGYSDFGHIENPTLRAWNQAATFFNMIGNKRLGLLKAQQYVQKLPAEERVKIKEIFKRIKEDGYEVTRASVNKELQFGVFEDDS